MKIPALTTEQLSVVFGWKTPYQNHANCFYVKAVSNNGYNTTRMTIITAKKAVSKSAVIRNRAERRIRGAIQNYYPKAQIKGSIIFNSMPLAHYSTIFKGYDLIFFAKPEAVVAPWPDLLEDMRKSLSLLQSKIDKPKKPFK